MGVPQWVVEDEEVVVVLLVCADAEVGVCEEDEEDAMLVEVGITGDETGGVDVVEA